MTRWPNQIRAYEQTLAAIERGVRRICVASPTGSGKTSCMFDMIEHATANDLRACLYTQRRMLFDQTAEKLRQAGITFGHRAAGHPKNLLHPVQICMTQSELSHVYKRKSRDLHDAQRVLMDEAHVQTADTMRQIMDDHVATGAVIVGYTATPLDLGDAYDELLVVGTPSECRQFGALVPAETFAPDEPDLRHIKNYKVGDDLTEKDNAKAIMRPGVFGRVLAAWKQHNPGQRPTLLFAPDVKGSIYFAEQFTEAGIPAAHIDGDDIWMNGESYSSDGDMRELVRDKLASGDIKVVCNRFVLREGIDWPFVECGILATVFGSLSSYIQSGGRLLRASPSTGKSKACIAKGSLVLTDRGEVPIESVLLSDKVWDGIEFVSHMGLAFNGYMEVISWDGLTATPEHEVLTENGWTTLAEAKASGQRITRAGNGWKEIRVSDDSDPHDIRDIGHARGGSILHVRKELVREISQDREARAEGVQALHETLWEALSGVDLSARSTPAQAMHRHRRPGLPRLRRTGNQVRLSGRVECDEMDRAESRASEKPKHDAGQNRQQRALRAGQPAMGYPIYAIEKPPKDAETKFSEQEICGSVSRSEVFTELVGHTLSQRHDGGTNSTTVEVYDLINAGPRHRYTVNGMIVSNCILDHGGNWWRHGSLNADRDWQLGMTNYRTVGERLERLRERQEPQPITCPKCNKVRQSGADCPACGFRYSKQSRPVVQIDGTLRNVEGPIMRPRKVVLKPDTQRLWESMYYRMRRAGKTFRQAEAFFCHEYHHWPPRDLKLMPRDPGDWWRRIDAVKPEALI